MNHHIFISIASYLDPMLFFTLNDAAAKAAQPELLRFAVIDQHYDDQREAVRALPCGAQVRYLHVHPADTLGVCWARNLALSLGMWNSQTVLLALIRKGLTREQGYELVQRNAMKTWQAKHAGTKDADFLKQLQTDAEVAKHFSKGELESLCSLDFHFKEVNYRFAKLGL